MTDNTFNSIVITEMEDNNMIKTTVKVDGMMCGMCESHVNDAVRKAFQVDKVTSSHSKGETVIISDGPVDEAKLKTAISATGYEVKGITSEPYEKKKGLFSFLHKEKYVLIFHEKPGRNCSVIEQFFPGFLLYQTPCCIQRYVSGR